jgi:beta-1,2-mannobiose phosphorylase / 1,2-beta-oligomannan phosphorylase
MIKFLGTAQREADALLFFRYSKGRLNFCKFASSTNGLEFNGDSKYVIVRSKNREIQNYDWKSFRITSQNGKYVLLYRQNNKSGPLKIAFSDQLTNFDIGTEIKNISETAVIVPQYTHGDKYVMYFGEKNIGVAYSNDLLNWKKNESPLLEKRSNEFDNGNLETGNAFVLSEGILLIYFVKRKHSYAVGACLFDKNNPESVIWRSKEPVWEQEEEIGDEKLSPLGAVLIKDKLFLYWQVGESSVYAVSMHVPGAESDQKHQGYSGIVRKHHKNPILSPRPGIHWDSRASFNSAAIYEDGKVHFFYRALGDRDLSVVGYATSSDGVTIDERSDEPVYFPREPFETPGGNAFARFADHFASGGGYGGIEDPRITKIDDKLYLTYVAFDGATPPRAAMSWIGMDDFRAKNWDKWAKAKLISAPGMVNKSAVLFPKKINGKYVMLHRVYPNILIDYLDDLEFDDYLKGHHFIPPRKKFWDSKKVGAGAPPILTKDGWLLIYQSVGHQDPGRYKVGAMVLDHDNPSKVLYRTHKPIIEPDQHYENNGFKTGVVYPCGAVIINDRLNIYYGGSDSFVCSASADLDHFLAKMKKNQEPSLDRVTSSLFN